MIDLRISCTVELQKIVPAEEDSDTITFVEHPQKLIPRKFIVLLGKSGDSESAMRVFKDPRKLRESPGSAIPRLEDSTKSF